MRDCMARAVAQAPVLLEPCDVPNFPQRGFTKASRGPSNCLPVSADACKSVRSRAAHSRRASVCVDDFVDNPARAALLSFELLAYCILTYRPRMKIALVTPARPVAHSGNRNTAMRWAQLLRELGHRVSVQTIWDGQSRSNDRTARTAQPRCNWPVLRMTIRRGRSC